VRDAEITRLLQRAADGDREALDGVAAWAFGELERVAASRMRRRYGPELPGVTLEPAALVNETFLRLLDKPHGFPSRRHFLSFANKIMLSALVDYQRSRLADKRGGGLVQVTMGDQVADVPSEVGVLELQEVLDQLRELDPRKAEIVELRVLWGAKLEEIAELLGLSRATVVRDWRFARLWIAQTLGLEP
jgi:RNA polymerase sigma factor (TIGR02999 family)